MLEFSHQLCIQYYDIYIKKEKVQLVILQTYEWSLSITLSAVYCKIPYYTIQILYKLKIQYDIFKSPICVQFVIIE